MSSNDSNIYIGNMEPYLPIISIMFEEDILEFSLPKVMFINQIEDAIMEIMSKYKNHKNVKLILGTRCLDQECLSLLSRSELSNIITHLEVKCFTPATIDLDCFESLKYFKGSKLNLQMSAGNTIEELELHRCIINCLPVNLLNLTIVDSNLAFNKQCRLQKLRILRVANSYNIMENANCSGMRFLPIFSDFILRNILSNNRIEEFSVIDRLHSGIEDLYRSEHLTAVGFVGDLPSGLPTSIKSLSILGGTVPQDLFNFSNLRSLKIQRPKNKLNSVTLPSLLTKLYIRNARNSQVELLEIPPGLLSFTLRECGITKFNSESLPNSLTKLIISGNEITDFQCSLPQLENLNLSDNCIKQISLNAPQLVDLNISGNELISMPKIPSSVKILDVSCNEIDITTIRNIPSSLEILTMYCGAEGSLKNFTFPSTLHTLDLSRNSLDISGVTFLPDSKLKRLDLSMALMGDINDDIIKLPPLLEKLDLSGNRLISLDCLQLPRSLKYLDLRSNYFKSGKVPQEYRVFL